MQFSIRVQDPSFIKPWWADGEYDDVRADRYARIVLLNHSTEIACKNCANIHGPCLEQMDILLVTLQGQ